MLCYAMLCLLYYTTGVYIYLYLTICIPDAEIYSFFLNEIII